MQPSVGTPARQPAAISLADIADHETELVFVGGRLDAIDGERLLVNDGTSLAAIRLPPAASVGSPAIGALVNARGQVTRTEQGGLEIVVASSEDIRILDATLTAAEPSSVAFNARLQPNLTAAATPLNVTRSNNAVIVLVIAGLLVLAVGLGATGLVIARHRELLPVAVQAVARLRARK
jgi:hypothetical protein